MTRRAPLVALIAAEAISALGRSMTVIAIPWFVLQTTGSGTKTGVVAAAEAIGLLVSVILSGPWIDRYGARRVSALTDLGTAAAVVAIPLAYLSTGLSLVALVLLSFAIGAGRSPARSAKQVLLPEAMAAAHAKVERGTSAQEGVLNLGNLLGAPLGGLLIALIGPLQVLMLDAGTLVVSALLVALVVRFAARTAQWEPSAANQRGYFGELRDGIRSLRADRLLVALAGVAALANAFFSGLHAVLLPAYGTRVWHDSTLVGIVVAAFGGGAVLGTVLYGWLGHRFRRRPAFAVSFLLFGAPSFVVIAANPHPVLLVALVLLFSLGFGPMNPIIAAVKYDRIPIELRGRVFGVLMGGAFAVMPLGPMLAGLLLDTIGLTPAMLTLGALTLALTMAPLIFPVWREMDAPAKVQANVSA